LTIVKIGKRPRLKFKPTEEEARKVLYDQSKADLKNYIQKYLDTLVRYWQFRARQMRASGVEVGYGTDLEVGEDSFKLTISIKISQETIWNYAKYLRKRYGQPFKESKPARRDLDLSGIPKEFGGGYEPIAEPLMEGGSEAAVSEEEEG